MKTLNVCLIGLIIGASILPTIQGNEILHSSNNSIETIHTTQIPNQYVGCSIELTGDILLNVKLQRFPMEKTSILLYYPMTLLPGYPVNVTINDQTFQYTSGGKITLYGFFGEINSTEGSMIDDKLSIYLKGKALYVRVDAEQNAILDDAYIPIVESLNTLIYPLENNPLQLSDDELQPLEYLSDCRIVGLGEATHGTKQFFALKHRIFQYLVENHGFKVFAFECDMGESLYVNDFVLNGEGDINDIMLYTMHFWTWCTEEVKDLLVWMKEYNQNKSDEDKIYFVGVDCQFLTYQSDILLDYINKSTITIPEQTFLFLQEIDEIGENLYKYYETISSDKKNEIRQKTEDLVTFLENHKDEFRAVSSEIEYQFMKQLASNINQVNDVAYSYTHSGLVNFRDVYMAENTLWTSSTFCGEDTKVALWAHNIHVSNVEWFQSIGFHLKKLLQDEYQIIDFGFSTGSFTAVNIEKLPYSLRTNYITRQPLIDSINYVCHFAKDDTFILKTSDIQPNSTFDTYISQLHDFLDIGAVFDGNSYHYYYETKLKDHCDILFYWDHTTASELLSPTTSSNMFTPLFNL